MAELTEKDFSALSVTAETAEKSDDGDAVICVSHLTKDYGHGRGVFDVSIKVKKGECYGYLGPNGAGKSTTIRHIMGFSAPQKGSVKLFGKETFGHTAEILGKVGYLPGEPSLPAGLDGWGFLRMMQDLRGERNEERLKYLLDLFKLDPGINVKTMSLGDKRKLAVVAAFMNDPDVLILDEPTSGLDPIMQSVFISFIIEEKKRGKTILLSSHIFSEVDATCDTISIIKDGVHVSTFRSEDLKNRDRQTFVLHFADVENMKEYLDKRCVYPVVFKNERDKTVGVDFPKAEYGKFFSGLKGIKITEFEEKPFTLQDYFMSFYKEEKKFGGLGGIESTAEVAVTEAKDVRKK